MNMNVTPIPHLAPGQLVKDWRRRYLAATATIEDEQRKQMIPAYVHRSEGEVLLAEAAIGEDTLIKALNELEDLIDGVVGKVARVNEFWALKPISKSYTDLVGYFFLLQNEAALAEISNDMLLMKYLHAVPDGDKIYESSKESIKADMSEDDVKAIFKIVKHKLETTNKVSHCSRDNVLVKTEKIDKDDVFTAEEKTPLWAAQLQEGMLELREQVENMKGVEYEDSSCSENDETNVLYNKSTMKKKKLDKWKCWVCHDKGHFSKQCPKRRCLRCGKEGHHEKRCYVKPTGNNAKPTKSG